MSSIHTVWHSDGIPEIFLLNVILKEKITSDDLYCKISQYAERKSIIQVFIKSKSLSAEFWYNLLANTSFFSPVKTQIFYFACSFPNVGCKKQYLTGGQ